MKPFKIVEVKHRSVGEYEANACVLDRQWRRRVWSKEWVWWWWGRRIPWRRGWPTPSLLQASRWVKSNHRTTYKEPPGLHAAPPVCCHYLWVPLHHALSWYFLKISGKNIFSFYLLVALNKCHITLLHQPSPSLLLLLRCLAPPRRQQGSRLTSRGPNLSWTDTASPPPPTKPSPPLRKPRRSSTSRRRKCSLYNTRLLCFICLMISRCTLWLLFVH